MPSDRAVRKLAAILAADIVGFSRLIETNEAGTLDQLKLLRVSVMDKLVDEYRGRVVKLMGDGMLIEFGSAVDAALCAVAIQRETVSRQAEVHPAEKIVFRIGINLGDVAVDGADLLGDGVNVAARLEQLCNPGGIVISGTVYDHLQGRFGLPLDFLGEHRVKNIRRPVRVYRVRFDGQKPPWIPRLASRRIVSFATTAVAVGLCLFGAVLWRAERSKPTGAASLAVIPFKNYGPDADARIVDGLSEDIVTDLGRNGGFLIMSLGATKAYKGDSVDLAVLKRELNVRYVLEGSVQRLNDRIKVTAQLLDTGTGAHLWSERYDRPARDLFDVESEISDEIANWLYWTVGSTEKLAAKKKRPTDVTAWESYLLGADSLGTATDKNIGDVQAHFLHAIELDPNFAAPHALLADSYSIANSYGAQNSDELLRKGEAAAKRAIELDPLNSQGHAALANIYCTRGNFSQCRNEFDRAKDLSPNSFEILGNFAGWASALGLPKEGAGAADRAIQIYPNYPLFASHQFPYAFFMVGRFDDAAKSAARLTPEIMRSFDWLIYAMSLASSGRDEEAKLVVQSGVEAFPAILNIEAQTSRPDWAPHELPLVIAGMRKAGFPLCSPERDRSGAPVPAPSKQLPECTRDRVKD